MLHQKISGLNVHTMNGPIFKECTKTQRTQKSKTSHYPSVQQTLKIGIHSKKITVRSICINSTSSQIQSGSISKNWIIQHGSHYRLNQGKTKARLKIGIRVIVSLPYRPRMLRKKISFKFRISINQKKILIKIMRMAFSSNINASIILNKELKKKYLITCKISNTKI